MLFTNHTYGKEIKRRNDVDGCGKSTSRRGKVCASRGMYKKVGDGDRGVQAGFKQGIRKRSIVLLLVSSTLDR